MILGFLQSLTVSQNIRQPAEIALRIGLAVVRDYLCARLFIAFHSAFSEQLACGGDQSALTSADAQSVQVFQQLARRARIAVLMYVKYPLSLRNVEDLLAERGIDICHETVSHWWNRFGPMFAAEIGKKRIHASRFFSNWRWHLDEAFVKINGELYYLWCAIDHEGEVLEVIATKRRDRKAALNLLRRLMKRYGKPQSVITDRLCSYGAAMRAPSH